MLLQIWLSALFVKKWMQQNKTVDSSSKVCGPTIPDCVMPVQGLNLTFEDNSQMASTWSRFNSHKCVSTSLGMCTAQNSHFYLLNKHEEM